MYYLYIYIIYIMCVYIFFWVDSLLIPADIEFLYVIYDCSRDLVKYSRQIWSAFLKKVKYFYGTLVWRHSKMFPASPKGVGLGICN